MENAPTCNTKCKLKGAKTCNNNSKHKFKSEINQFKSNYSATKIYIKVVL